MFEKGSPEGFDYMYHWWIYQYVINTKGFMWTIVIIIFLFNILAPIIIWNVISSKPLPLLKSLKAKLKKGNTSSTN